MTNPGDQTIFRAHRTERDKWTPLLNETIRDPRLSFRATGLLVFLLSLPPDWKANQQHIASCKTEGRDAVITAWNELRQLDYISKEFLRDAGRIIGTIWHIYESPHRSTGKPETVEPETVEPKSDNPTVQTTKRKKSQNTQITADAASVAISFGEFWNAYPRKTQKATAEKAFSKHFDKIEDMLSALHRHKKTDQWQRGIIPHPATWINQKRWEDDLTHDEKRTQDNSKRNPNGAGRSSGTSNETRTDQYAGAGRVH